MSRCGNFGDILSSKSSDQVLELASFDRSHLLGFLDIKVVVGTDVFKFSLASIIDSPQLIFLKVK